MLHHVKISLLCVPSWKITPFLQLLYNDMADTLHIFIKPHTFFTRSHINLHDHLTDPIYAVGHILLHHILLLLLKNYNSLPYQLTLHIYHPEV